METDDLKETGIEPKVRAAAAKRRWTRKEAARIVSAQQQSGLSVQTFAKQLGCDSWRLYKWRRQLGLAPAPSSRRPKKGAPPVDIVPLSVATPSPVPAKTAAPRTEIRHPCGLRIRFSHPPPESFLQHLLQILVPLC